MRSAPIRTHLLVCRAFLRVLQVDTRSETEEKPALGCDFAAHEVGLTCRLEQSSFGMGKFGRAVGVPIPQRFSSTAGAMSDENTRQSVRLDLFDNSWFSARRPLLTRMLWMAANEVFFATGVPWPSSFKAWVLRRFGATIGKDVIIKNRVNIKYPWNLEVGDFTWIGEGVWIDSLTTVRIGAHACLSQGCMIETGNHDWSDVRFGLLVSPVVIEDGAWAAVRSTLLPGARLSSHSVLAGGSVLSGATEPYSVYAEVPAVRARERRVSQETRRQVMKAPKKALVTGITGQDGSYLTEAPARKGLSGPRHHPPVEFVQHGSN